MNHDSSVTSIANAIRNTQKYQPIPWSNNLQYKVQDSHKDVVNRSENGGKKMIYFFLLLDLGAVVDETLAAREVDAELTLPLLTALTCLFYSRC